MNVRISQTEKVKIMNSVDLYAVMQKILLRDRKIDRGKEHFWVIGLASNNRILYIELVGLGTVNAVLVDPMDIFSIALQKRTVKVVLVHNHPSGELRPSREDKDITDRMLQVGYFLGIPVIEHLIISEEGYYSFVDSGLLEELSFSKKYVLAYKEQEKLKAEAQALGEKLGEAKGLQKGREAEKLSVALAMKAEGMEAAAIARITGLSLAKVKGLKAPKRSSKASVSKVK
ncbi:MAG: DNA repair protein [Bacteroidetes bacterium]|nr:DNA repair protein [Bacteroidota bacterium]